MQREQEEITAFILASKVYYNGPAPFLSTLGEKTYLLNLNWKIVCCVLLHLLCVSNSLLRSFLYCALGICCQYTALEPTGVLHLSLFLSLSFNCVTF